MERLLDIEIKAWNRAEKWLRNALKKLQTLKNLDVSDSYPSLLSSTSTRLQLPGNRNSSNKSATYYSAHSVEGGADSINNGIHYCDDDDCTRYIFILFPFSTPILLILGIFSFKKVGF